MWLYKLLLSCYFSYLVSQRELSLVVVVVEKSPGEFILAGTFALKLFSGVVGWLVGRLSDKQGRRNVTSPSEDKMGQAR